ncbi:hypothetical protein EYF80_006167 [Liparis tanakae]|uniref:Uncharacterized protein n=1 Tax=Liparis tanakae TaxID=230148 RepID=A0A4Z2J0B1_9TELE|nr:hypothetical protein EYF80_006167 [Liparis tanakae]
MPYSPGCTHSEALASAAKTTGFILKVAITLRTPPPSSSFPFLYPPSCPPHVTLPSPPPVPLTFIGPEFGWHHGNRRLPGNLAWVGSKVPPGRHWLGVACVCGLSPRQVATARPAWRSAVGSR